MDVKEWLASAVVQLRNMATELGRFMARSEEVFLSTGVKLQQLEAEANRMLSESSTYTRMGTSGGGPVERLRAALGDIDVHLERRRSETETGLHALGEVLSGINKLTRLDGDFQLIVATLHALASTTHLENSRQYISGTGFDSVVGDLRTMALRIKPKFAEVMAQSGDVHATAKGALAHARTFLERHERNVAGLRLDTRKHLAAMSDACQTSEKMADTSTESMSQVKSSASKVLQSLQVQDLARQMIEHVVEDLQEFITGAQAAIDADVPLPELRSWLAELALVSKLGAAQVSNALDRVVRELSQIDRSLQSVVATLSVLAKESARLAGKNQVTSVFAQLERGIRSTTETVRIHDSQADTMLAVLAKVSENARGVGALVDEVARLGEDARFIGLNAMVKAVRVGQSGATLTVLAREIQVVSDQIQALTTSAASIMESVDREALRMVDATPAGSATIHRAGDGAASRLEQLVDELGAYQSSLAKAVSVLLSGSDALRIQVAQTGRGIHDLVEQAQRLHSISAELSSLQDRAAADAGGAAPPPGRSHRANERHTMEEERQIHRLALGTASSNPHEKIGEAADVQSAEGSVEFF